MAGCPSLPVEPGTRWTRPPTWRAGRPGRLSAPALKAFFTMMARWKVRDEDARALLGGMTNGPYYELEAQP
ncbi:MAG: hypothetical protein R2712_03700 [Vicinamibacterales bacterium]